MIILHVVEPFATGIATFLTQLVHYLPEHQHIILHGERDFVEPASIVKKRFKTDNVKFIKWKNAQRELNLFKDLKALFSLRKVIKKISPDIVHLHSSKAGFLGRITAKTLNYKNIIYTPNGVSFIRTDISFSKKMVFSGLERFANRFHGFVVSSSLSENISLISVGINAITINNGTTIPDYKTPPPHKEIKIFFTGNITDQKSPEDFNKIASYFLNNENVKFYWIGKGKLQHQLESKNIEITGWLTKNEMLNFIPKMDLYLSCAKWEGLPYAALEAMALRKAMLMTPCVGNIDLVKEGVNGFTFKSIEQAVSKINYFIENQTKLKEFGNESFNICNSKYNVESCVNEYAKLYDHVSTHYKK